MVEKKSTSDINPFEDVMLEKQKQQD